MNLKKNLKNEYYLFFTLIFFLNFCNSFILLNNPPINLYVCAINQFVFYYYKFFIKYFDIIAANKECIYYRY